MAKTSENSKVILGDLSEVSLFDLTQFFSTNQKSGLLTLRNGSERGFVYFENGAIINAISDDLTQGIAVLKQFFRWDHGSFEFDGAQSSHERSISIPTDTLLFDIAREMDEAGEEEIATEPAKDHLKELFTEAVGTPAALCQSLQNDGSIALDDLLAFFVGIDQPAILIKPRRRIYARSAHGLKPVGTNTVTEAQMGILLRAVDEVLSGRGLADRGLFHHETLGSFWLARSLDNNGPGLEIGRIQNTPPDPLVFNQWPGALEKISHHAEPVLLLGNAPQRLTEIALAAAAALASGGKHVTCYQRIPTHAMADLNGVIRLLSPQTRAGQIDVVATLDGTEPTDVVVFADPMNAHLVGELSRYRSGGMPIVAAALFTDYHNRPQRDVSETVGADAQSERELVAISVHPDDAVAK